MDYLESNKKLNSEDEKLQQCFKNLFTTNLKRFNQQPDKENELWHLLEPGKLPAIFHGKVRCRFSSKFLRENKNWLK